ncbi:MAG: hypothetical protein FWD24_02095 [Treponema sp.]|nr:hypothetical protein [Treponema sp.]
MAGKNIKSINFSENFLAETQRRRERKEKLGIIIRNQSINLKSSFAPLRLCVILFFFISCQTIPKVPDAFLEDAKYVPLNNGASVYIFADVKRARPILDIMPLEELNDDMASQMLNRTDYLAAALFPKESGQRFQLAAWGNYPSTMAGMAFNMDKNWQSVRTQANQSYWHSSANKLSITMSSKQAFIASSLTDDPFFPIAAFPGKEIPEGFNSFRKDSPLSFWIENPGPVIARALTQIGFRFPIQQFFINLYEVDVNYEAMIRLQFNNATYARGTAAVLNLAGNFASNDPIAKLFLSNPPVQNGNIIDIKTAILTEAELVHVLNMFMF